MSLASAWDVWTASMAPGIRGGADPKFGRPGLRQVPEPSVGALVSYSCPGALIAFGFPANPLSEVCRSRRSFVGSFVRSFVRGGGGNRTRVLRLLNGPSPSAAGSLVSGPEPPPAVAQDPSHPLLFPRAGRQLPAGESC